MRRSASKIADGGAGTNGASSTSSSNTATIMTGVSEAEGDKIKPIVDQIMNREKENQDSVKKLRHALAIDGKSCIQMALALHSKKHAVNSLVRENENMEAAIKEALQHIRIIAARKQQEPPVVVDEKGTPIAGQQIPLGELQNQLKNLQQALDDLLKERQMGSQWPGDKSKMSNTGKRVADDKSAKDPAKRHQDLRRRKNLVKELKSIVAEWLKKVSDLKSGEAGQSPPTTFPAGVQYILKYVEAKMASSPQPPELPAPSTGDREDKAKAVESERRKSEVHGLVTKRLADRKPLENLPSKIRRDYEFVCQERGQNTVILPESKTNLVQYLTELFEWGKKEHERHQDKIYKLTTALKSIKGKADGDEKLKRKLVSDLDAEIRRAEQTLEKAKGENRDYRNQASQVAQNVETNNARRKAICLEIKTLKPTKIAETSDRMESLQKETQAENKKFDETQKAVNELTLAKLRKEDELKRLEDVIREQKRRLDDDDRKKLTSVGMTPSSHPPSVRESFSSTGHPGRTEVLIINYNKD